MGIVFFRNRLWKFESRVYVTFVIKGIIKR